MSDSSPKAYGNRFKSLTPLKQQSSSQSEKSVESVKDKLQYRVFKQTVRDEKEKLEMFIHQIMNCLSINVDSLAKNETPGTNSSSFQAGEKPKEKTTAHSWVKKTETLFSQAESSLMTISSQTNTYVSGAEARFDSARFRILNRHIENINSKGRELKRLRQDYEQRRDRLELLGASLSGETETPDESRRGEGSSLQGAIVSSLNIIDQAGALQEKIHRQTDSLLRAERRVNRILQTLPGIGRLMERINQTELKNQVILYGVFYICLYFFITGLI